jgi:hypothetical protein
MWKKPANWYILIAVLFVSSDSLVAFNKFYNPLVLSSFIIMIYLIAVFDCIRYFKIQKAFSNLENAIYFFLKLPQLMGNLSLKLHINTSQLALKRTIKTLQKPAPSNMNIGQAPTRAQPNPKNTQLDNAEP